MVLLILSMGLEYLYVHTFFNFTFRTEDALARNPSKIAVTWLVLRFVSVLGYLAFGSGKMV